MGHLTKDQIARRVVAMDALRDLRVLGAIWACGSESGVNEAGQEVMRSLHSPIATVQHLWCDEGKHGVAFRQLIVDFLAEQERM